MTKQATSGSDQPSRIDWAAVHRRLENVAASLERGARLSPEEALDVLRERAEILARAPAQREPAGQRLAVIEFLLAHERYAIDSAFVREVYPLKDLTALPCTPAFIRGIVNLRGEIISVVDLKTFFGLPERGLTDLNKIIILNDGAMELGLLVDAVVEAHAIALRDIQPPLPTLTGIRAQYLKGVTGHGMVVLDAAKILIDPKIIVADVGAAELRS
jgi:purine-binding chemotaxis protein CheW